MEGTGERPRTVRLLALPETTPATLYALYEVFAAVGSAWTELTGEPAAVPAPDVRIVASRPDLRPSPTGIPIAPHGALGATAPDLMVVTDLALSAGDDPRGRWREEAAWARGCLERGAVVASVCTGTLFLAEAGLLDGCEATSHWGAAGMIRAQYPAVRLRPERVLCLSGPEQRIVTAGGVAAWEDLALYLAARLWGQSEAVRLSKVFLIGDRSEGQLPFAAASQPRRHEDAAVARAQAWVADNYAAPRPVAGMAAQSGLATRTFTRRFRAATGYAPLEYVQTLRLEEARQILETTDEPVEEVGPLVGYEDPTAFRRLFKRRTGVTPARYRRRYRAVGRVVSGGAPASPRPGA